MASEPLRRVLVANRGEIARRLIRGAYDAGCEAVAVYAADDAASPHVGEADAAVLLVGASLRETYLDADALVGAALASGADALHPGYGFLSENPALPEACARAGVVWIGPPAEAMRVMGHKARAKVVVEAAGVPVLPSAVVSSGATDAALADLAAGVGYPLLVKASAGGGGRGMRLVEAPGELAEAVAAAQREAAAAFGSDEVFVERYLSDPRHVEVQIIGDTHGNVLHLFDRECSVQRRHQKVVEEAPAVNVADGDAPPMWEAAVAAAKAVGYVGVGTVEYLVDASGFYFLEMNTRLQVEHGVTELVTGLDLVGLQLAVASGRPLPFAQDGVTTTGHAVEVAAVRREPAGRVPADARHGGARALARGAGVRVDRGIESGSVVSPAYDSLVAKLMAHGDDRVGAIARLSLALRGWSWTASRPTASCSGRCSTTGRSGAGRSISTISRGGPTCATPSWPTTCASATPPRSGSASWNSGPRTAWCRFPAAGWRNVGRALHADELRDAGGEIEVRVAAPEGPRRCGSRATASGRPWGRRPHATASSTWRRGRPATPLPGPAGRARRLRERARGPVDASRGAPRTTPPSGAAWPASAARRCPGP